MKHRVIYHTVYNMKKKIERWNKKKQILLKKSTKH